MLFITKVCSKFKKAAQGISYYHF